MKGVKLYYVPETRQFVPAEKLPRKEGTPFIIQDTCDPFLSHADGKIYDSKSAYRRELKARGFVELGSDRVSERQRDTAPGLRQDIVRAYRDHWK